ncbi:outer membrane protein assembly factor BamB [Arsukibacterium sp.]|uniref:outer membrane protein assembly factor BamB n=1 Tax=Arsukibacterium sp. TaxID=1977258 RepID=UPI002FDA0C76
MVTVKRLAALALVLAIAGCSNKEKLLLPEVENRFTPDRVWDAQVGKGVAHYDSALTPLMTEDTIYAASREGIVASIELSSGKRNWTFDARKGETISRLRRVLMTWSDKTALLAGGVGYGYGKVFVGTENGEVLALDKDSGELLWRTKVKGEVLATPVAGDNLVVVALGSGSIVALDPQTGEQRWLFENEMPALSLRGVSQPVIDSGGVVYGTASGRIGVLVVDRGFQAWEEVVATPKGSTDLSRLVDVKAKPLVIAGTIYTIAFNGELMALELRTGRQLWKRDYASFRNMAVSGNTLYIVDSEARIHAVDRRNGTEIWSQTGLHRHMLTGPAVYKDYLVVGDNKGNLHWLDRANGDLVSRQLFDPSGFYADPVANNDYLLVTSRDGELVLLKTP